MFKFFGWMVSQEEFTKKTFQSSDLPNKPTTTSDFPPSQSQFWILT